MNISFSAVFFPIIACASLGLLLVAPEWPNGKVTRIIVGVLDLVYAIVLAIQYFSAAASA